MDRRGLRTLDPLNRGDERFVAALVEALAVQKAALTDTRGRMLLQAKPLVAERFGEGMVPIPSRSTSCRLVRELTQACTPSPQRPRAGLSPTA